ncbi:hypothetical protein ACIBQ6_06140 [Nonomuraea sp. NPDC049655]
MAVVAAGPALRSPVGRRALVVVLGVTAWMARVAGKAPTPSRVGQTGQ